MTLLVITMGVGALYMMRSTYMPLSIRSSSLVLAGVFVHAIPVFTGESVHAAARPCELAGPLTNSGAQQAMVRNPHHVSLPRSSHWNRDGEHRLR